MTAPAIGSWSGASARSSNVTVAGVGHHDHVAEAVVQRMAADQLVEPVAPVGVGEPDRSEEHVRHGIDPETLDHRPGVSRRCGEHHRPRRQRRPQPRHLVGTGLRAHHEDPLEVRHAPDASGDVVL